MRWMVAFVVLSLFAGLAGLFTAAAFAIRRDFKERFDRIDARLRQQAESVIRNLPHHTDRCP